jgi:hypothetical protein
MLMNQLLVIKLGVSKSTRGPSMTNAISFDVEIVGIHPLEERQWAGGIGKEAKFIMITVGWVVTMSNGMQWRFMHKPPLDLGPVMITLDQSNG